MRRASAAAALAAAALAGAAPATAAPGLETVIQDDRLLLHRPVDEVRASMRRIRALGADRVRLTANWSVLTRDASSERRPAFDARDPAAYEQGRWRNLDDAVTAAREAGLRISIDIGYWAPHWAASDPPGPRARTNVHPGHFADFAVAVARRYSGRFVVPVADPQAPPPAPPPPSDDGQLLDAILGGGDEPPAPAPAPTPSTPAGAPLPAVGQFVLWNEPNHQALLGPQWRRVRGRWEPASPGVYRPMLRAAYPAAKRARPDAAFLVGNTSSTRGKDGSGAVGPLRFLRGLACVDRRLRPLRRGGCARFTRIPGDGWAHHPYSVNERPDRRSRGKRRDDARIGDLDRLARLLDALADRRRLSPRLRAIHVNEFGYETAKIGNRPVLSQSQQARWMTWAERVASRVPAVKSFAQFLLADQPPAKVRVSNSQRRAFGQYYTGLYDTRGRAKLAATTFRAGLFAGLLRRGRVELWGRLRLGGGPRDVAIERSVRGRRWRPLVALRADGQGTFARVVRHVAGSRYRLRYPDGSGRIAAGLPVPAVRPRR